MATRPKAGDTPAKPAPNTMYVVLRSTGGTNAWEVSGHYATSSSEAAIRAYLKTATVVDGIALVAVPARSWQPVKPKTSTKVVTTLEPIKEAS